MTDKQKRLSAGGTRIRIEPLNSVGGILSEMGKVYAAARHGRLDINESYKLVSMLAMMRQAYESSEIERRIEDLEQDMPDPRRGLN